MFQLFRLAAQVCVIVGLLWSIAAGANTVLYLVAGLHGAPDPEDFAKWGHIARTVPWTLLLCLCVWVVANGGPRRPRPTPAV
jgi:hypothetical protein